ncbi:MAG: hypothetical protein K1X88_20145 [Nannocystaceae bacterium]|nr:hypothetical protein [Nannocystaceae bacterium]
MPFTRAVRTDTVANIADFGALPGVDSGNALTNAAAFQAAFAVSNRVLIPATPAGQFYAFQQFTVGGNPWLPAGVELFGEGPTRSRLRYYPVGLTPPESALRFAPGFSRGLMHSFYLAGPRSYPDSTRTGISFEQSQFNAVRDVWIEDFAVGVRFNTDASAGYSAYNVLERFEIQRITGSGILMGDNANCESVGPGRCQYVLNSAGTDGVAIHLAGSFASPLGVKGPNGIMIRSVASDTAFTCLRIRNARGVVVAGCYFEPFDGSPPRLMMDIDSASEDINLLGNAFSPPSPPASEADATPTFVQQVPEARGPALEGPSFPARGYFNARTQGASTSGATAAHANRIKNGDMSRGVLFWPTLNMGTGSQTSVTTSYVISGRSIQLTVGSNQQFHMYQDVVLNSGLRSVTVCVRYKLLSGSNAFRVELADVASGTTLGFYSDNAAGGANSSWKIRALTGRFEGLPGDVTGPRTMRVRIYPYRNPDDLPSGQQVLVDSVWLVDGEYAAPYRPYTEAIELLRGDDRQILVGALYTAPVAATALAFANMPANAVGAILELSISATQGSTVSTFLRIDDLEGGAQQHPRDLAAPANARVALTDFLIPVTPGGAMPTWQLVGPSASNSTFAGIRLKAWIMRM